VFQNLVWNLVNKAIFRKLFFEPFETQAIKDMDLIKELFKYFVIIKDSNEKKYILQKNKENLLKMK